MKIDCHSHFEPRLMNREQVLAEMDLHGIDQMVLVPLLTNPPESVKPGALMKIQRFMFNSNLLRPTAIAITKSMYNEEGEWDLKLLKYFMKTDNQKLEIVQEPDNQTIAQRVAEQPERFMGWIFVNPRRPSSLADLQKYHGQKGMIGIKLHPFWHRFNMPDAQPVFEFARQHRLPVNIHLGFDGAGDYRWVLKNFPDVKVVFGHLGVPYYKSLWPLVRDHANAYMDVASTYHVDRSLIHGAIKAVGPEKILFATDTPYTKQGSMKQLADWIEELPLTPEQKAAIFYKNFQKLIQRA